MFYRLHTYTDNIISEIMFSVSRATLIGAKDCTPEINTSEIILDFQWHFPMDCQWHFPTEFHWSAVFSEALVQWIFTRISQ